MALYNFQKRFVPMILDGSKTHTIRAKRKRKTKPGEMLHLYTGLRQKGAKLLMRVPCTRIEDISMCRDQDQIIVQINGELIADDEREQLARRDGFAGWRSMLFFWKDRLPFHGDIIHWKTPVPHTLQDQLRRKVTGQA